MVPQNASGQDYTVWHGTVAAARGDNNSNIVVVVSTSISSSMLFTH
jgi:hypothetical protein